MSPRTPNPEIKDYRPVLSIEARDALTELAEALRFIVTRRGTYEGTPSVRELLESLAAAYNRDPAAVHLALKVLGVTANPSPDDVRFSSEPEDTGGSTSLSGTLTTKLIRGSGND